MGSVVHFVNLGLIERLESGTGYLRISVFVNVKIDVRAILPEMPRNDKGVSKRNSDSTDATNMALSTTSNVTVLPTATTVAWPCMRLI